MGVSPCVVHVAVCFTLAPVGNDARINPLQVGIHTLKELAREELHAHDAEDEPEHQAHKNDIHNGWDGQHQGVHHNLEQQWSMRYIYLLNQRPNISIWFLLKGNMYRAMTTKHMKHEM